MTLDRLFVADMMRRHYWRRTLTSFQGISRVCTQARPTVNQSCTSDVATVRKECKMKNENEMNLSFWSGEGSVLFRFGLTVPLLTYV